MTDFETLADTLEAEFLEASERLEALKDQTVPALQALREPDVTELFKISPLSSGLEQFFGMKRSYGVARLVAPIRQTLDSLNAHGTFIAKVYKGLVYCAILWLSVAAISYVVKAFLNAPVLTLALTIAGGFAWRWAVRWLKHSDRKALERMTQNGIRTRTMFPITNMGQQWRCFEKKSGQEGHFSEIQFNIHGMCEGMTLMDVYAGGNQQYVGSVRSDGRYFHSGQFDYPESVDLPETFRAYFAQLSGLLQPLQQRFEVEREIADIQEVARDAKAMYEVWRDVHVPREVKLRFAQMLDLFRNADPASPRGLLLYGPPGTGKTLIAKAIAESCGVAFFATSLPDFKMGHVGQSAQKVKTFWNNVREHGRAIIFIDECEGVFGSRGSVDSDSFTAEIVQTFLAEWDGLNTKGKAPNIWVIGATNRRELIDAAILSRFGQEIEIPLPDGAMRRQILEAELEAINLSTEWLPDNTDKLTQGLSGRDLNRLSSAIRMVMGLEAAPTPEHLKVALAQMRERGATVTDDEARWDTLVLDDRTIKELKTVCGMLNHADTLRKQGVAIPRGIIFHGPPGTGKTQIARTLANESGLNFIAATTSDLKASYLGQSGNKVKELFARVRSQNPAILFLDEVDIICPARGMGSDAYAQEIIGQLLQELDGVKAVTEHVFVVAATNQLDSIDSAVLSRFPKQIEIPLPDLAARKQLLAIMLRKLNHTLTEADICKLADNSHGKSGRDLRSMVENAQNNAVARALESGEPGKVQLTPEDFLWR